METWKDIKGCKGYYKVSTLGRVVSVRRNKLVKQYVSGWGYQRVKLSVDGKQKIVAIHKLVLDNFISNPNNYPYGNHIDGNKLNNSIENIEWCSASQNTQHAHNMGLAYSYKGKDHPLSKAVIGVNENETMEFGSISEAARFFMGTDTAIRTAIRKSRKSFGYIWKLK